jgi:pimeloyl-ACP methyl ester carboxylesterase
LKNLRKYGKQPFHIAVMHGGPGASGEMAPVARELSHRRGIIEPLQTENSIKGQVEELKSILEKRADLPIILIGFSWGAWLSLIFAAEHPNIITKLILISAGPFEEKYADRILETRLSRLSEKEKLQVTLLVDSLNETQPGEKNTLFAKLGKSLSKADAYDPIEDSSEEIVCRYEIFQSIWKEAAQLRRNGMLLEYSKKIRCPVTAIHGDYDAHPPEGVEKPLSKHIKNFQFILLQNCGHKPWLEKQAKEHFYSIVEKELG